MKNSNNNINNCGKPSKWKKSVTLIIVLVTTCSISAYVGVKTVNGSSEKNINVIGNSTNEALETVEDKPQESKSEVVVEQPAPTKTFNDFSNEYLVNFVTEFNTVFNNMRGKRLFEKIEEKDRKLYPLPEPYETIEKRKVALEKYFMDSVVKENYTTKDGNTYVEELNNQNFCYTYYFKSVLTREENGDILRVKFNIEPVEGFKGVKRNTKTLDFKIKNGELKLNSKCFEDSFLNFAENINDTTDIDYTKKEQELYATVENKLRTVLRPDQKIDGFLNIDKYPLSNDKAYGIAIAEPTQNAICYFMNIRTGEIYGHYEKRVVAK